jgi:hypothetical protein
LGAWLDSASDGNRGIAISRALAQDEASQAEDRGSRSRTDSFLRKRI